MRKNRTGESLATLVDSVTNKTYAQVPIKSVPIELGASIATAYLF
ncbi:TPA: hypothetical protein ACPQXP_001830 [Streptococcus mutans]